MTETEISAMTPLGPHWPELVRRFVIQSEVEGGVRLDRVPPGTVLEVRTANRVYTLVSEGSNQVRISGHPQFCPEPVAACVHGSTWGGSMLKQRFIGRGMHLEFQVPGELPITTTSIVDVREK